MDAAVEIGRNPASKHQIKPECGDEQAEAGRDCRTRPAKRNSQARTGTGKYSFSPSYFPVQLTTSSISNPNRLILTLAICDGHTYIHSPHILCTAEYRSTGCQPDPGRTTDKMNISLSPLAPENLVSRRRTGDDFSTSTTCS